MVTAEIPVELQPQEDGARYRLKAALVRTSGRHTKSDRGGHYACIMLDGDDVRVYNDASVNKLDTRKGGAEKALNIWLERADQRPYSLLYDRID